MKKYLPNWFKSPLRRLSDRTFREGAFFERQGRRDLIHKAMIMLDFNGIEGAYAEFGCCGAYTFGCAAEAIRRCRHVARPMVAFDSFSGLPPADCPVDEHPRWVNGSMAMGLEEFRAACRRMGIEGFGIVPGYYSETLPGQPDDFLPAGQIAMAYIDCDMYGSTSFVLTFLRPRLQHGMILAFDDYWCYSRDAISGERKAFLEILIPCTEWNFEPYQAFGWSGMSFVVERRASGDSADA